MASTPYEPALSAQLMSDEAAWGLSGARRTVAISAVLAGMVLVVLDAASLNVALPTIARALHETAAMSVRYITAYQIGLMMTLLPAAALGESVGYRRGLRGRRRIVHGRLRLVRVVAIHALADRGLLPAGSRRSCRHGLERRAVALYRPATAARCRDRLNALTVALAYAGGPTIGAVILSRAGWPWLFAINIPLGMAVLLACRALPHVAGTRRRLDILSVALNNGGFAALVVGAEMLPTRPALAVVLLVAAAFTLTALVRREMSSVAPLVPLDLLRGGSFRLAVIASVCCFAAQMMGLVALPFYLQHKLGQAA